MHGHFWHTLHYVTVDRLGGTSIEPDLFDNNVPFDNTTSIYLLNLLWKLGFGLRLDLELHYFSIFHGKKEHLIFREFHGT